MMYCLSILCTILIITTVKFTHIFALKFYPALVNFTGFCIFFSSLFKQETVIQFVAKRIQGKELSDVTKNYTRNLTYVWCAFLLFNCCLSLITVFLSENIWALYNGFITYILTGLVFAIEYIIRIRFKRKHDV